MLRNEGAIEVLKGVSIAKSLKKFSIADNQFNDDEEVMKMIEFCMVKNKNLGKYDFNHNNISDFGLKTLTTILTTNAPHIFEVNIPERVEEKATFEEFRAALAGNKPKKGKKGKGGKKKKKKG